MWLLLWCINSSTGINKLNESGARLKIKKFRIRPRIPTVKRILKTLLDAKQLPKEIEESLPEVASEFVNQLVPVAFYETWTRDEMPEPFKFFLDEAGLGKAVSVTAMVATVGTLPEVKLSELLMNGETTRSHVISALSEESADLSLNFLTKLLAEDARQDDCDVGDPIMITEESFLSEVLLTLEAEEEDIHLDPASHLTPRFTRVALAAWVPVTKKKKQGFSAKKR